MYMGFSLREEGANQLLEEQELLLGQIPGVGLEMLSTRIKAS